MSFVRRGNQWWGPTCVGGASLFMLDFAAGLDMIRLPFSGLFLVGLVLWLGGGIMALREKQYRWVLASLPFMLTPAVLFYLIWRSCLQQGDCL